MCLEANATLSRLGPLEPGLKWPLPSAKAKSFRSLMQGQHEALLEDLLALIFDKVQLVKAGVCRRQALLWAIRLVDLEALRSPNALQRPNAYFSFQICCVEAP